MARKSFSYHLLLSMLCSRFRIEFCVGFVLHAIACGYLHVTYRRSGSGLVRDSLSFPPFWIFRITKIDGPTERATHTRGKVRDGGTSPAFHFIPYVPSSNWESLPLLTLDRSIVFLLTDSQIYPPVSPVKTQYMSPQSPLIPLAKLTRPIQSLVT